MNRNWAEKGKGKKKNRKRRKAPAGREIRAMAVRQRRKPGLVVGEAESWRGQGSAIHSAVTGRSL